MLSLAIVAGLALAYRIRGHRPDGGLLNRLMHPVLTLRPLWAASVFAAVYVLTADPWIAGAVALGEWAGLHIRHAPGQDMGTWAGTVAEDVIAMAIVGTQRAMIVGAALGAAWLAGLVPTFALAWAALPPLYALTLPAAYWLGWRIPLRVPPILRGGIEWSELLAGASRGVVFLLIF